MRAVVLGALVALGLAAPAGDAAAEAGGDTTLSLSAGYATVAIPDVDGQGAQLGLELERGLGETLWLRGAAAGAVLAADGEAAWSGQASIGITYVVDVLRYVPYLHGGLGVAALGGGALEREWHPVAELGAGLDVLRGRDLSWGPYVRLASFLDDAAFAGVGLRLSWRWSVF